MTLKQAKKLEPGRIVIGRFFSDRSEGVGIVTRRGRELWTQVDDGYVPVRVITGNRCNGGYRIEDLRATEWKAHR